jgi:polyisoprenoid-binding protein YceI
MKIEGTSSLHDWDMKVEKFNCDLSLIIGNPSITIENVNFTGVSSTISSHNSIMDSKTRSALKADKYPEIKFTMTSPLKIVAQGNSFSGSATGELNIAGKARTVNLPFSGKKISDNTINISGAKKIDMTEYGINPPTAIFGTLKTGKDVIVSFEINLKQYGGEPDVSLK